MPEPHRINIEDAVCLWADRFMDGYDDEACDDYRNELLAVIYAWHYEQEEPQPKGTTMPTALAGHTNSEQWTGALVIDSLSRLWQLKDKWVCVTQELDGSPQTCAWSELVERWGPIIGVSLDA